MIYYMNVDDDDDESICKSRTWQFEWKIGFSEWEGAGATYDPIYRNPRTTSEWISRRLGGGSGKCVREVGIGFD